ncbi:MAG: VOC family protein [Pirellulaceae bacterium]
MPVSPIPAGYHSVTPYLIVSDGKRAIEFYKHAFGATEVLRLQSPDGKIGHAEVKIGDSHVMLADEFPEMGAKSPQSIGGTPVGFCIYLANVDAAFDKAVAAGGKVERPVQDQFYGDRSGTIIDPFGHKWTLATHIEDVPQAEVERRFAAMMKPA